MQDIIAENGEGTMQDLRAGSQNDDLEQSDAIFITIYPN